MSTVTDCKTIRGDLSSANKALDLSDTALKDCAIDLKKAEKNKNRKPKKDGVAIAKSPYLQSLNHIISNFKNKMIGTAHGLEREHLVYEIAEFEWKFLHTNDTQHTRFLALIDSLVHTIPNTHEEMIDRCLAIRCNDYQPEGIEDFYVDLYPKTQDRFERVSKELDYGKIAEVMFKKEGIMVECRQCRKYPETYAKNPVNNARFIECMEEVNGYFSTEKLEHLRRAKCKKDTLV